MLAAVGYLSLRVPGAAADPVKPQPPAATPSAEEEATTYERCMKLARQIPPPRKAWRNPGTSGAAPIRPTIAPRSP